MLNLKIIENFACRTLQKSLQGSIRPVLNCSNALSLVLFKFYMYPRYQRGFVFNRNFIFGNNRILIFILGISNRRNLLQDLINFLLKFLY